MKNQLDVTCYFISLVVLQPAKRTPPNISRSKNSNTQRTENKTTDVVIHQHSRGLLRMDVLVSETCWAHNKWNKIASDIKLVFHSSTNWLVFISWSVLVLIRKSILALPEPSLSILTGLKRTWNSVKSLAWGCLTICRSAVGQRRCVSVLFRSCLDTDWLPVPWISVALSIIVKRIWCAAEGWSMELYLHYIIHPYLTTLIVIGQSGSNWLERMCQEEKQSGHLPGGTGNNYEGSQNSRLPTAIWIRDL